MSIDQPINVFFTIVLTEAMVAMGLRVMFAEVVGVAKNRRLVARAAVGARA